MVEQSGRAGLAMYDGGELPLPEGADPTFLRLWRSSRQRKHIRAQAYFEAYGAHRPARLAAQPYLRPWGHMLRQAAQCLRLAYGPEAPPGVAVLGAWIAEQCEVSMMTEAMTDPLVIPEGDDLAGLPPLFVAELSMVRSSVWDELGNSDREALDRDRGIALFRRVLAEPAPASTADLDRHIFATRRLIWWIRDTDYLGTLQTLREQLPVLRPQPLALAEQLARILGENELPQRSPDHARALFEIIDAELPALRAAPPSPRMSSLLDSIEELSAKVRADP